MIGIQGENALEEVTKSPCDTSLDANSTNAVENRVVTQAINEINSDLSNYQLKEWKYHGKAHGTSAYILPQNYTELYFKMSLYGNKSYIVDFTIPYRAIDGTETHNVCGNQNTYGTFNLSTTTFQMITSVANGQDKKADCDIYIYYR